MVATSSIANITSVSSNVATAGTVNLSVIPSTSMGGGSLIPVSLSPVVTSGSMISFAPAGSSPSKLNSSISHLVQNAGKQVILTPTNAVSRPLTSTSMGEYN